jgi:hypothetical protein
MIMPLKTLAVVELDENGNVIPKEPTKEGEVTTTSIEPDCTCTCAGQSGSIAPDKGTIDNDTSTSTNDKNRTAADDVAFVGKSKATNLEIASLRNNNNNNNSILYIILAGITGIALGGFGSHYIMLIKGINNKKGL